MTILFSKRFLSLLRAWIRSFLLEFFVCPCSARFSLNVTQRRQNTYTGMKKRFRSFFSIIFFISDIHFFTESVLLQGLFRASSELHSTAICSIRNCERCEYTSHQQGQCKILESDHELLKSRRFYPGVICYLVSRLISANRGLSDIVNTDISFYIFKNLGHTFVFSICVKD